MLCRPNVQTSSKVESEDALPYHGAAPVHEAFRAIIANVPDGSLMPMSASVMTERMESKHGLSRAMACRLFSQIRKGGALHHEWKHAFASQKFKRSTERKKGDKSTSPGTPPVVEYDKSSHRFSPCSTMTSASFDFELVAQIEEKLIEQKLPRFSPCSTMNSESSVDELVAQIEENPWITFDKFDASVMVAEDPALFKLI